ncbi:alanine racemase, catabolic [Enterobacter cancerogenus]|uniref:Alanine racemase, catabolic n=1 Tax=Enterobacter cancerogenus TaxID=69218 RepID=A0A484W772_9ENTR|nr:alanine racemase, catabolic [Enterobacter cancerogenus]
MSRPVLAQLDLQALKDNLQIVRRVLRRVHASGRLSKRTPTGTVLTVSGARLARPTALPY